MFSSLDRSSPASWKPYRRGFTIVVLLAVLAGALVVMVPLTGGFRSSRQSLTITKPKGGTILSRGIRCGTLGSDCSTSYANGETVELQVQADAGFVFAGYTGDCAPSGRTIMNGARTCGAKLAPVPNTGTAAVRLLTIIPPKGGTIVSPGITCGTLGSECSAKYPDGAPVKLDVLADTGFAFARFTGDCSPDGDITMTGPLTCSAAFSPRSASATPPPTGAAVVIPPAALEVPMFPWPPPRASSQAVIDLKDQVLISHTLREVDSVISLALVRSGYDERSYFAVPGGFALVTRLEQTYEDGSPKPGAERWSVRVDPFSGSFTLNNYLKALLGATPGYFRVIVFVFTTVPFSQSSATVSRDDAAVWLKQGLNRLPDDIGEMRSLPQHSCTALVYEFESNNAQAVLKLPGRLTGKMHLEKASLLAALGGV